VLSPFGAVRFVTWHPIAAMDLGALRPHHHGVDVDHQHAGERGPVLQTEPWFAPLALGPYGHFQAVSVGAWPSGPRGNDGSDASRIAAMSVTTYSPTIVP